MFEKLSSSIAELFRMPSKTAEELFPHLTPKNELPSKYESVVLAHVEVDKIILIGIAEYRNHLGWCLSALDRFKSSSTELTDDCFTHWICCYDLENYKNRTI